MPAFLSFCLAICVPRRSEKHLNQHFYSSIRLLGRDEWIFLDKDPKANRQNIIELPS